MRAQPTTTDAAARAVVRLADGRTGRVLFVPGQSARKSKGRKARVVLPSGAVLSVAVDELAITGGDT